MLDTSENPSEILSLLQSAMEDEMNSVANCLRNTFLNKIPSEEEIAMTCHHLAEKLALNNAARNDVKLALMDVLEEALQGKQVNK